jgi:23S rRNA (adenine2503-C2)-methyltransferase
MHSCCQEFVPVKSMGGESRDDLLGLPWPAFRDWARGVAGHDDRPWRALYRHLHRTGRFEPAVFRGWQDGGAKGTVVDRLPEADFVPAVMEVQAAEVAPPIEGTACGTTRKLLIRLADGAQVETVCIPMGATDGAPDHYTVCVSSQVGCRMGCTFCRTATMGLVRNLTAHEIIAQVVAVRRQFGIAPRNVVFMGMGEPLDNAEAVAQAVQVLTDVMGHALQQRHVTVSTVGRADVLHRWSDLGFTGINLAVSLFAAQDNLRSAFMPINRRIPLSDLRAALTTIPVRRGRRILCSVVVIPGENDHPTAVADLARFVTGLPVLVNLIPYNPIPERPWRAPTAAEVFAVRDSLRAAGVEVRLRATKGDAVLAACGQLATVRRRHESTRLSNVL